MAKKIKCVFIVRGKLDIGKTRLIKEVCRKLVKDGYVFEDFLSKDNDFKINQSTSTNEKNDDIFGVLKGIDTISVLSCGDDNDESLIKTRINKLKENKPDIIICSSRVPFEGNNEPESIIEKTKSNFGEKIEIKIVEINDNSELEAKASQLYEEIKRILRGF